jgi:hypothetical protein
LPYFTVARYSERWLFKSPEGRPFFSIGLNHVDSATLRYPENIQLWCEKYGNSQQRWLQEAVAPDLRAWGFNTLGWGQEVIIRGKTIHRHSRNFTPEEYQWLGLPYYLRNRVGRPASAMSSSRSSARASSAPRPRRMPRRRCGRRGSQRLRRSEKTKLTLGVECVTFLPSELLGFDPSLGQGRGEEAGVTT